MNSKRESGFRKQALDEIFKSLMKVRYYQRHRFLTVANIAKADNR